jgi:hypothetical protein
MRISTIAALTTCLLFVSLPTQAADLTTTSGRTYHACKVIQVSADGITFRHSKGLAKVLFSDMTPSAQKEYGYDPQKEQAYEKKVKEERAKKKEIAQQRAAEQAKAQAEANLRAMEYRTLLAIQRNSAAAYGGFPFLGFAGGIDPSFGNSRGWNGYSGLGHRPSSTSLAAHYGALVNFGCGVNGAHVPRHYGAPVYGGYHGVGAPMRAPCAPIRSSVVIGGGAHH